MPDALAVEMKVLGVEKAAKDIEKISKEMQAVERVMRGSGGTFGYNKAELNEIKRRTVEKEQSEARIQRNAVQAQRQQAREAAQMQRQQDAVQKKQQQDQKRFQQLTQRDKPDYASIIGSTRIGFGQDGRMEIMPLISGLTRAFGPIAPIVTAAMAAMQAFDEAAKEAAQNMRNFRMAQYISGGTAGEVGAGKVLGRYLGYDEADAGKAFAQQSREFSNRISPGGDPNAQNFANQYGIHDTGLYGGTDKMKNFLDWTEKLRSMPDEQAQRAATATGTNELLPIRDLAPDVYNQLRQEAIRQGNLNDPDTLRREANRHAREVMDDLNNPLSRENLGRAWHEGWGGGGMGGSGYNIIGNNQNGADGQNHQQRQTTAAERTANATESLNQLARAGQYGGGERAGGAIPSAFTGSGWQIKQLTAQAHALGAFSL